MRCVWNGIDQPEALDRALKGKRLGVVTGGAAVDKHLRLAVDVLCERYHVTRLFNTIYGIRGEFIYGENVPLYTDTVTGRPVESIFNRQRIAPTEEMLADVDAVVFDIREAGARFFEYLHCCAAIMKACAAHHKELVVLDRVAPIGGLKVEGTVCPPEMHTIVGDYELATRTALTMGEFARYVNGEFAIGCDLTVIPVQGWTRELYYDETDLPWLLPSPSLSGVTANLLYPGMCIFEGVRTVSEGRGTSKPFELIGAPWIDGRALAARMERLDLPGVSFAPVYFRPSASKHANQTCQGVQVIIRDRASFESVRTALALLDALRALYPQQILWEDCSAGHDVLTLPSAPDFDRYTDKLLADKDYTSGRLDGDALLAKHAPALAAYVKRKAAYHLYE